MSKQNQTRVFLLNKPFRVLTQFTDSDQRSTLADYISEPDIYPAGRLDYDSEGLLLLTNNGRLQQLISAPRFKMSKTYWVQVEGALDQNALTQLRQGVNLKDGLTRPAQAKIIPEPKQIWSRHPPIRERKEIPTSWLELTISEGRNRQVRRMTAAVGFPTLRLIRAAIGPWMLEQLKPGEWRELSIDDLPASLQQALAAPKPPKQKRHPNTKMPKKRSQPAKRPGRHRSGAQSTRKRST